MPFGGICNTTRKITWEVVTNKVRSLTETKLKTAERQFFFIPSPPIGAMESNYNGI
jgi:hypothetical protein